MAQQITTVRLLDEHDSIELQVEGLSFPLTRNVALRFAAHILIQYEVVTLEWPWQAKDVSQLLDAIRTKRLDEFLDSFV